MSAVRTRRHLMTALADFLDLSDEHFESYSKELLLVFDSKITPNQWCDLSEDIIRRLPSGLLRHRPFELCAGQGSSQMSEDNEREMSDLSTIEDGEGNFARAEDGCPHGAMSSTDSSSSSEGEHTDFDTSIEDLEDEDEQEQRRKPKSSLSGNVRSSLKQETNCENLLGEKEGIEEEDWWELSDGDDVEEHTDSERGNPKPSATVYNTSACKSPDEETNMYKKQDYSFSVKQDNRHVDHTLQTQLRNIMQLTFPCLVCDSDISSLGEQDLYNHVRNCLLERSEMTCPACDTDLLDGFETAKECIEHVISCMLRIALDMPNARSGDVEMLDRAVRSLEEVDGNTPLPTPEPELVDIADTVSDRKEPCAGDQLPELGIECTPFCQLCGTNLSKFEMADRVDHFNKCWERRTVNTFIPHFPLSEEAPRLRPSAPPPPPSISPVQDIVGSAHTAPPEIKPLPKTSCLLCTNDLSSRSAVQVLHHRAMCLYRSTRNCPVCEKSLSMEANEVQNSLWHLQNRQNGTTDNPSWFERDDFEGLYMSWCGMAERLGHVINQWEGKGRTDRLRYSAKMKMKRENGGIYWCGESRLREMVGAGEDGECVA